MQPTGPSRREVPDLERLGALFSNGAVGGVVLTGFLVTTAPT